MDAHSRRRAALAAIDRIMAGERPDAPRMPEPRKQQGRIEPVGNPRGRGVRYRLASTV